MNAATIRSLQQQDNQAIAAIIRNTLAEFGAAHPGTVYFDPTTDDLFQLFQREGSQYFVAENAQGLLGGAGIFPTEGLPERTAELVKIYLLPSARNQGLGRRLMETCIGFAKKAGYTKIYLESMPELRHAVKLYEKLGFVFLDRPLGQSGHFGCSIWMLKDLENEP